MRIVVTGKTGQIAQSLIERAPAHGATVVAVGRPELDLADTNPAAITRLLTSIRPEFIVSAAAYTAVDKAESEADLAHAINAEGPRALAKAAAALDIPLLHISTDYVFDGSKAGAWTEQDTPSPLTAYGASKLAGEAAVLAETPANTVIRVGWVYSPFSANFAKTILRLTGDRNLLRVVADQTGGPTSAFDIADSIIAMARNIHAAPGVAELRGLFHMSPPDTGTWADFAEAICDWLRENRDRDVRVDRITTAEYPTPARRPANSRLNCDRLATVHGIRLPSWRASLPGVLQRLA